MNFKISDYILSSSCPLAPLEIVKPFLYFLKHDILRASCLQIEFFNGICHWSTILPHYNAILHSIFSNGINKCQFKDFLLFWFFASWDHGAVIVIWDYYIWHPTGELNLTELTFCYLFPSKSKLFLTNLVPQWLFNNYAIPSIIQYTK